jgi:hypothetical protein
MFAFVDRLSTLLTRLHELDTALHATVHEEERTQLAAALLEVGREVEHWAAPPPRRRVDLREHLDVLKRLAARRIAVQHRVDGSHAQAERARGSLRRADERLAVGRESLA